MFTSFVYAEAFFLPDIVPIHWGYGRVHGHRLFRPNKMPNQDTKTMDKNSGTCSIYQRKFSPHTLPWPHSIRLVHPILLAVHSSEVYPILAIVPDYGHSRPRSSPHRQRRTSTTQPP